MKAIKLFLISMVLCVVAACSTTGTDFNITVADSFVVGETTYDEVLEAIGSSPIAQRTLENGNKKYRWAYIYADAALRSEGKVLDLEFDGEGVLVREHRRGEI